MEYNLAERSEGQFAGAIKRFDTNDALSEEQVDELAERVADMFEASAVSRLSKQTLEQLVNED